MKPEDKAALKDHLMAWREKLSAQLPTLKEGAKPVAPDNALGRLTRLDAMQSQEINKSTLQQVRQQLNGIERALKEMGNPGFGLCVECDQPIPPGRLKAMPGVRHCVTCV